MVAYLLRHLPNKRKKAHPVRHNTDEERLKIHTWNLLKGIDKQKRQNYAGTARHGTGGIVALTLHLVNLLFVIDL